MNNYLLTMTVFLPGDDRIIEFKQLAISDPRVNNGVFFFNTGTDGTMRGIPIQHIREMSWVPKQA